jgi:hypothetical protein
MQGALRTRPQSLSLAVNFFAHAALTVRKNIQRKILTTTLSHLHRKNTFCSTKKFYCTVNSSTGAKSGDDPTPVLYFRRWGPSLVSRNHAGQERKEKSRRHVFKKDIGLKPRLIRAVLP